ncbi:hypothetical protein [Streptomyces sp. SAS_270]|uniref:hypothetical protein n=1 Tax=Streptomyces sp. SAS_270 TaxID=3412748 RepID=UPI00403C622D
MIERAPTGAGNGARDAKTNRNKFDGREMVGHSAPSVQVWRPCLSNFQSKRFDGIFDDLVPLLPDEKIKSCRSHDNRR